MSTPAPVPSSPVPDQNLKRWTGFLRYSGRSGVDIEEIDVDAPDEATAREAIERIVREEYEPGGTVTRVVLRTGFYL